MATAIPTYKRQVLPGGVQSNPGASAAVNSQSYMGQALGNAGDALGNVATKIQQQQNEIIENRSKVDTQNLLSDSDVYWQEQFTERATKWKVGDPSLRDSLGADFKKWSAQTVEGIATPESKNYFLSHAAEMNKRLQMNAFSYQQKATTTKLNVDSALSLESDKKTVAADPSRYNDVYSRRAESTLARSDMDEVEKAKAANNDRQELSRATELGEMERDPVGWYRKRFGSLKTDAEGNPTFPATVAPGSSSLKGDSSLPAGLRNDNPFNIKYVGQRDSTGPSQNTDQGDPQAIYQDVETGVAAGYKLALRKYGAGKTSANQLIAAQGGWTPGNKDAAANVAKSMGLGPDDDMRLKDPGQLEKFGRALIKQEQGTANSKVSDETLKSVADSVMAGRPVQVAKADTGTMTDASGVAGAAPMPEVPATYANLDLDKQIAMKHHAETRIKQGMAVQRAQFEKQLTDLTAAHKDGIVEPTPLQPEAFAMALGQKDGAVAYAQYTASRTMGTDLASFKQMPNDEIIRTVTASRPTEAGPGYAAADVRANIRLQAATQIIKQRNDDPAAYVATTSKAVRESMDGIATGGSAEAYATASLAEQRRLGVKAPQLLSNAQSEQIAGKFQDQSAGAASAADLMGQLQKQWGAAFPLVYQQLQCSDKLPQEAIVIPNMKDPISKANMAAVAKIKEADLANMVPSGTQKDVSERLLSLMQPFQTSTVGVQGGGARTFAMVQKSAEKLAMFYVASGKGVKDAAAQAYEETVGHAYQFEGSYRVPKTEQPDVVVKGIKAITFAAADFPVAIPPAPAGMRPADAEAQYRSSLKNNIAVVTNSDESGVVLYEKTMTGLVPVRAPGGKQIGYSWQDLRTRAAAAEQTRENVRQDARQQELDQLLQEMNDQARQRAIDSAVAPSFGGG